MESTVAETTPNGVIREGDDGNDDDVGSSANIRSIYVPAHRIPASTIATSSITGIMATSSAHRNIHDSPLTMTPL